MGAASREKFVLGILIEDVVNYLNSVNEAGLDGADAVPGFPAIHADAHCLDFAAGAQLLDRADGTIVVEPVVFPGVVLNEVESFDADIAQTFVNVFEDIFGRIGNVKRKVGLRGPAAILWRNLGGGMELLRGIGAQGFAKECFAVAFAVRPCGVKEIAAEIDGALERGQRFRIVGPGPAAHAPHAVADFANLPAGSSEGAITQEEPPKGGTG